jgi:hypothetical protein
MRFSKDILSSVTDRFNAVKTHPIRVLRKSHFGGLTKNPRRTRELIATSCAVGMAAIVGAYHFTAAEILGISAPNYSATYDNVKAPQGKAKGSQLIAVMSAIIDDELARGLGSSGTYLTSTAHWRTDTTAFQTAEFELIGLMANTLKVYMAPQGARVFGNDHLNRAASRLQIDKGIFLPFYGTNHYFAEGSQGLKDYNNDLAQGTARLPLRVSDVEAALSTMMFITGQQEEKITATMNGSHFLVGYDRDVYIGTIGAFHGSCELLKALKGDYDKVIDDQGASDPYQEAIDATCAVANRPIPSIFNVWGSNLDKDKEGFQGAASRAVGFMANAHGKLVGAGNAPH